jgi:serine/threonine protein kinase
MAARRCVDNEFCDMHSCFHKAPYNVGQHIVEATVFVGKDGKTSDGVPPLSTAHVKNIKVIGKGGWGLVFELEYHGLPDYDGKSCIDCPTRKCSIIVKRNAIVDQDTKEPIKDTDKVYFSKETGDQISKEDYDKNPAAGEIKDRIKHEYETMNKQEYAINKTLSMMYHRFGYEDYTQLKSGAADDPAVGVYKSFVNPAYQYTPTALGSFGPTRYLPAGTLGAGQTEAIPAFAYTFMLREAYDVFALSKISKLTPEETVNPAENPFHADNLPTDVEDLRKFLKILIKGPWTALNTIHKVGYLHCDVKPHNMLMTHSKSAKGKIEIHKFIVIDFGLATRASLRFGKDEKKDGKPVMIDDPYNPGTKIPHEIIDETLVDEFGYYSIRPLCARLDYYPGTPGYRFSGKPSTVNYRSNSIAKPAGEYEETISSETVEAAQSGGKPVLFTSFYDYWGLQKSLDQVYSKITNETIKKFARTMNVLIFNDIKSTIYPEDAAQTPTDPDFATGKHSYTAIKSFWETLKSKPEFKDIPDYNPPGHRGGSRKRKIKKIRKTSRSTRKFRN